MGDVANNLSFQMTSMFLMVYMTDIVGLSAGAAGTIYAVTKVWAGVADLVAGNTVDKANTRWGRLRPWLLWGSTPLAILPRLGPLCRARGVRPQPLRGRHPRPALRRRRHHHR